jgi:hypothetical protein
MRVLLDSLRTSAEPIVHEPRIPCVAHLFRIAPLKFDVLRVATYQTLIACTQTSLGIRQRILQRLSEEIAEVLIPQFAGALVEAISHIAAAIRSMLVSSVIVRMKKQCKFSWPGVLSCSTYQRMTAAACILRKVQALDQVGEKLYECLDPAVKSKVQEREINFEDFLGCFLSVPEIRRAAVSVRDSVFKRGLSNRRFIIRQWRAMAGFEELLFTKGWARPVPALLEKYHATSDKIEDSVFLHIAHELFPDSAKRRQITCIAFPPAHPETRMNGLQKEQDCQPYCEI